MEADGGMARDRKAEDHFGRREERQKGDPPRILVGLHPFSHSLKGLEQRPERKAVFERSAAPNRCEHLGGVWMPAHIEECTKFFWPGHDFHDLLAMTKCTEHWSPFFIKNA